MPINTSKTVTDVKLTDLFFPKSLDRMDTWTHVDRRSIWRTTAVTFCPGTKFVPARREMLWCLIHRIHSLHFLQADVLFTQSVFHIIPHVCDCEDTQHTRDVVLRRLYGCGVQLVRHKRGAVACCSVYSQFQPLADRQCSQLLAKLAVI